MVVLLAIAGAVAAVLFNRASTETGRLEAQQTQVEMYAITNDVLCRQAGGTWASAARTGTDLTADNAGIAAALTRSGITTSAAAVAGPNKGFCHPK